MMIDIAGLTGSPTTNDFIFRIGNDNNPAAWAAAPEPTSILVRPNAGVNGSSRVELVWADGSLKNTWLQVTVKATATTGLAQTDVFYFGNAVGESGNSATNAVVNSTDELAARSNPRTFLDPALANSLYDYNRDGLVNAIDQILARSNSTTLATSLKLITVPTNMQTVSAEDGRLVAAQYNLTNGLATLQASRVDVAAAAALLTFDSELIVLDRHASPLKASDASVEVLSAVVQQLGGEEDQETLVDDDLYDLIAGDLITSRH